MKEIDRSTVRLLRHLAGNRERLQKKMRLYNLVVCVDIDRNEVARVVKENDLDDLAIAVVSSGQKDFKAWKIHPKAKSTLVVINRGKTVRTIADLEPKEIPGLEAKLEGWLGKKKKS